MPTRQDQLHSYQYAMQRVVAALVSRDPDPARSPMRRAGTTALVSLLIASLAVGATAIYGILTGNGNTDPRDSSVILQEKGTGAQFVYLKADSRLHPVLNYTSGLLLAEGSPAAVKGISARKLSDVPIGPALGIAGAPDSLPEKSALLPGSWSVCTQREDAGLRSTVLVGTAPGGGRPASTKREALLVSEPNGRVSLVDGNRKFSIPPGAERRTQNALGYNAQTPWPVTTAWINAIPSGPDLVAPQLPNPNGNSPVAGLKVGQVITDVNQTQFAVLLSDGVAAVTQFQAMLLRAVQGAQPPVPVNNFVDLRASQAQISDAGQAGALPATVPALAEGTPQRACVTLPIRDQARDGVRIDPDIPEGTAIPQSETPGQVRANFVHVPRGSGAVVGSLPNPESPQLGTVGVVTDTGTMFPLANPDLLTKLGYGKVKPVAVPSEIVSLLAPGPSLDPEQAQRPAAPTPAQSESPAGQ
ncbi:type VII secretion protein EccB [Paractinoplanes lichenicola]|uniref:Type VII secretion protein EccB n=1 Tax=Paractinoplanes lichenicola TaxID=2802976 RepID=A0ABS1VWI4_9ACTN|nr:type VII secretion protein EccB [Actinoplanes lichenicola]MBL7258793.1 type VII secretion protein EccB [Actinoplanes lichenicola]